jgi:hypothetical protein
MALNAAWQSRFRFGNHASDKEKCRLSIWLTRASQCARGRASGRSAVIAFAANLGALGEVLRVVLPVERRRAGVCRGCHIAFGAGSQQ